MEIPVKRIILFITQMIIVFCVITASIANLTLDSNHREMWIAVLSSTLAHILKAPDFKKTSTETPENRRSIVHHV